MPRHDSCPSLRAEPRRGKAPVWQKGSKVRAIKKKVATEAAVGEKSKSHTRKKMSPN